MERFWNKVKKTDSCWLWTAFKNDQGYGYFRLNGSIQKAHRVSYELAFGKVKEGFCVCHKCDNPPCVNPSHLFIGTNADNMRDKRLKDRCWKGGKPPIKTGENNTQSVLTETIVLSIRREFTGKRGNYTALSKRYSVDRKTIYNIVRRFQWKHI